jgi:hypothetical protein
MLCYENVMFYKIFIKVYINALLIFDATLTSTTPVAAAHATAVIMTIIITTAVST